MQLPIINLNGTARHDLLRDHIEALQALQEAIGKLSAVSPHGRDYQTTPGAYEIARSEHADRITKLRQVAAEIETIAESLA